MTSIEEEISESFGRIRGLIADLKATSDRADPRVEEQIRIISNTMEQPLQDYRLEQTQFSRKLREQVRRRYQISHPEATETEVSEGVENVIQGGEQLFAVCDISSPTCVYKQLSLTQTKVQGTRTQKANDARNAVEQRSATIRRIERDLMTVATLFQEIAELVDEHEFTVEKIQDHTAAAHDDLRSGNEKLSFAVTSARNARKYKWYILLVIGEFSSEGSSNLEGNNFHRFNANKKIVLIIAIIVGASVGWCKATDHC
jgi:syntaxin 1B/2/3